jgi:phosphoribosylglycinamide formyltransferase-1
MPERSPAGRLRLGVLASGRGSNLQAIIDAIEEGRLQAQVAVVISNKKDAPALERARRHGLTDVFLDPKPYAGRPDARAAYDQAVLEALRKHDVELVLLAGYMKIVTPLLIEAYRNRMMNIHPALLPAFPGLDGQRQALDWGAKIAGCTVHFVTEGVDEGPIIVQAAVPVVEGDTAETLSARILKKEHSLYPMAVQWYAEGRLQVEGRRVRVRRETESPERDLINPA